MATQPAGKKPAPRKTTPKPAPAKAAGSATPAKRAPAKRPARKAAKTTADSAAQLLTPKESRFVDEYLVDLNATQAAIRAGYSERTARQIASENLSKPHIQAGIAQARKQQQERTHITADAMLQQAWLIATADVRELVEMKVACCRHCWGENFRYQRTVSEMNSDRGKWLEAGKDPAEFDEQGGIGFNPHRPPHPDCTACVGDGHAREVIKDTRYLSPAAAQLYAGVKRTKDGLQVLTHSREAFAEKVWKYLGMYERDNQQKTDPLTTLLARIASGNNNGFKTVEDDPEARPRGSNSIMPRQTLDDEDN